MWTLILLFTVIPALEITLLVAIGMRFGPMTTLLLILLTGVFGGWLAKREGISVLREVVADLQQGIPPAERLAEGALVLVGGVLLITPGILTDLTGLILVFPWSRRRLAPRLLRWAASTFKFSAVNVGAPRPAKERPSPHPEPRPLPFDHPVR